MKLSGTLLVLIIVLCLSSLTSATTIINFEGTVNRIYTYDGSSITYLNSSDLFGDLFAIGDTFTGGAEYDYTTHQIAGGPNHAVYNHTTLKGLTVDYGYYLFDSFGSEADNGFVQVQNNYQHGSSTKDVFNISDRYTKDSLTHDGEMYLFDDTASVFNDLLMPTSINGSDFNTHIFHQSFVNELGHQLHVYGGLNTVTSYQAGAPVPEPKTLMLFGIGLLSIAWVGRKSTVKQNEYLIDNRVTC